MNPWLTIWTRPLAALRAQVEQAPGRHMLLLASLHGLVVLSYLPFFYRSGAGFLMGSAVALGLGALIGWAVWQAKSWTLFWLGTKFGGASLEAVRCVVAWAFLPGIASAIVWETIVAAGWANPPMMTLVVFLLFVGAGLWGVIITVRACADQNGLRSGQAIGFTSAASALILAIGFVSMLAKGAILNVAGNFVDALALPPQFP